MTGEEKLDVQKMRGQGLGYMQIAGTLGISVNTVKSFCRRNNLTACNASKDTKSEENKEICKYCGKRLKQTEKQKAKTLCSDRCRLAWWGENRNRLNQKAVYRIVCNHCGKPFDSYGNKGRKYCSHACYIAHRFSGVAQS